MRFLVQGVGANQRAKSTEPHSITEVFLGTDPNSTRTHDSLFLLFLKVIVILLFDGQLSSAPSEVSLHSGGL